jgi:hypothetical protein
MGCLNSPVPPRQTIDLQFSYLWCLFYETVASLPLDFEYYYDFTIINYPVSFSLPKYLPNLSYLASPYLPTLLGRVSKRCGPPYSRQAIHHPRSGHL